MEGDPLRRLLAKGRGGQAGKDSLRQKPDVETKFITGASGKPAQAQPLHEAPVFISRLKSG
jgi:hypothetical protein